MAELNYSASFYDISLPRESAQIKLYLEAVFLVLMFWGKYLDLGSLS
jgi:hypothetical protein